MFILRKISKKNNYELNFILGDSYTLILKESSPEEFEKYLTIAAQPENLYGYISGEGGKIHDLWSTQHNYVMTSNGRTYSNVSLK